MHKLVFRQPVYLVVIIVLALITRLVVSFFQAEQVLPLPGIADQVTYHALAQRLVGGFGFTFASDWWPFTRAGQPTAHWSYPYTLFLSAFYYLFGVHPLIVRIVQAVAAGILMPWFVYRLAGWVFNALENRGVGQNTIFSHSIKRLTASKWIPLIAAGWVALYGYFIYYASALMTETFYMIAVLWALDCSIRIHHYFKHNAEPGAFSYWLWLELGLAVSVAALLRQVFLIFFPFLFLWFLWASKDWFVTPVSPRDRLLPLLRGAFLILAVLFIFILPVTAYNYTRFNQFVLLNTNAGFAFFWGNHPVYGDRFVPILTEEMPSYQSLVPQELQALDEASLDRRLLRAGLGFIADDPQRFIRLSISRIPAYFMFWPSPSSSLPSNLTRVFSFGIALPFILFGIFCWIQDVRKMSLPSSPGVLLLLFMIVYSLIHLVSWSLIRYRLPVDAVGLVFASRGFYWILDKLSRAVSNRPPQTPLQNSPLCL